jgi:hypothetical protein
LDTQPNQLGAEFRQALYRQTAGHALFTVELLRAMQARGELVQDEERRWVEGPALDWRTLPVRVEGVIEERIGRLEAELRELLFVASVEGENFTAEVVARIQGLSQWQLLQHLSQDLGQRHRLVRERTGGGQSRPAATVALPVYPYPVSALPLRQPECRGTTVTAW